MDSNPSPTITKRLWHILPLIYYMLRNSITKRKLMMELQLFFKRRKLATSRNAACHSVGLSCSDTPFYLANKRKNRRSIDDGFHAGMFADAFEGMGFGMTPSPSPGGLWWLGRSPVVVRQLRVTDSPFMGIEEEMVEEGKVDKEAEDFIMWFREQLRREMVAMESA